MLTNLLRKLRIIKHQPMSVLSISELWENADSRRWLLADMPDWDAYQTNLVWCGVERGYVRRADLDKREKTGGFVRNITVKIDS